MNASSGDDEREALPLLLLDQGVCTFKPVSILCLLFPVLLKAKVENVFNWVNIRVFVPN
jgi:hypothetical protein